MSLIDILLSLPEHGEPMIVRRDTEAIIRQASTRFVRYRGGAWSLTRDGRRFLAQFRPDRSTPVGRIVVRLVREQGEPMFHLLCDTGQVLRVRRANLLHCLRTLRAGNPGVKITFDFRHSGRVS